MITSPSNQHIALLRSLHAPKGRRQEGLFLLEGPHLLAAALAASVIPRLIVFEPESLERTVAGRQLMGTIEDVTSDRSLHTRDLGGTATTAQVTDAVCDRLAARGDRAAA